MAALKCQYAKTHTRLEFAPLMASSSLFHLFTLAAVLCVSASLSKARSDIIPVEHPAVWGSVSLGEVEMNAGVCTSLLSILFWRKMMCASSQLESSR